MSNFNQNRKAKLIEMLEQAPNDEFLNYALAMEELALENLQSAVSCFQKCIEINPKHIPARFQMAKIEHLSGKDANAVALLNEGIELLSKTKDSKTLNEFRSLLNEIEFS